ncbi:Src kinase-associated phosphoprotein 2 [Anthophora plagiata]
MVLDTEITDLLRDMVEFLECVREVKLSISLESIRNNLLIRSKDTLTTMFAMENVTSPEPYLYMNAAGSKGLIKATLKTEAELQEYVRADAEHRQMQKQSPQRKPQESQQDGYYETFQPIETSQSNNAATTAAVHEATDKLQNKDDRVENTLVNIYASFTAAQTKSKCQMCGSLYRKEGKKLFVFEQYRACWVGLVGTHLLIYGNDRDNRPYTILPIRGYMARAAPNAILRDQRRSESAFEIFRPGNRTFQFVAKTPKDMEEWVRKICELVEKGERKHEFPKAIPCATANIVSTIGIDQSNTQEDVNGKEERYQDIGSLSVDKLSEVSSLIVPSNIINEDATVVQEEDISSQDTFREHANSSSPPTSSPSPPPPPRPPPLPPPPPPPPAPLSPADAAGLSSTLLSSPPPPPPLPSRVPRKLPSPPRSSYEFPDEEEDDIYHKIEDFRDTVRYGNIGETFQIRSDDDRSTKESTTYDDVRASVQSESMSEESRRKKNLARKSVDLQAEETYDDTVSKDNKAVDEGNNLVSYDNVQSLVSNAKARETDESTKSPQKKSFLDRVRSKRESPRKVEKKAKRKSATKPKLPPTSPPSPLPSTVSSEEVPTYYDDVSDLVNVQQETNHFEEEQPEYTCPPPPRPIYGKPVAIVDATDPDEFYDDVAAYRDKSKNDRETSKSDQQISKKLNYLHEPIRVDADRPILCENIDYSQQSFEDNEHYKTPRVEPRCCDKVHVPEVKRTEELYDDIAILADFTARQKEVIGKKSNEGVTKSQINLEKRSWNRFVTGRKSKVPAESTVSEMNGRIPTNGIDDPSDDLGEQHGSMRMNTFQKLFSRMENSLGKASVRTASSMLSNKTNSTNNA